MSTVVMNKKDEIIMKLVHYFVTEENYNPIVVNGVKDEIWLENQNGPYRIIRINSNNIFNKEQLNYDYFKIESIVKQIKKKTLSFKVNILNILLDVNEDLELEGTNNIVPVALEEDASDIKKEEILEAFPNINEKLLKDTTGIDLIINVTKDINEKTEKENKVYTSIEAIKDIFIGKQNTEVMTWNKLYRLELFNKYDVRFPVGKLNEDNFTTYKLYYYSNTISLINDKLYYYLQRKDSIMNTSFNKKRLDSISEVKTFFSDKSVNLENEIKAYEYFTKINLLNVMIREKYDKETRNNLIKSMKAKGKSLRKNKCISIKFKFVLFMIRKNIKMYEKLLLLKDKMQKRKIKTIQ